MNDLHSSPHEALADIRNLMQRSSRFISLSGLSGVFAGIYALAGAYIAYHFLHLDAQGSTAGKYLNVNRSLQTDFIWFFILDASIVLFLAISTGIFFTTRKARKDGNSIFDATAIKLVMNLCIPLFVGGVFCLALINNRSYGYIAPAMLLFYGLALVNASKYSREDIRYLGFMEILLGLVSAFLIGYGFLFWCIGFGILHIVYGTYMYLKYEVEKPAAQF